MRAGINILSIIIPIAIVLMITVIAFAVYKISYKRKINKRLAEGRDADIKPMMSPVKFVVTTLLSFQCKSEQAEKRACSISEYSFFKR